MEQKSKESSLVIAKSIHTIVCNDSERQRETAREEGGKHAQTANRRHSVHTSQAGAVLVMSQSIRYFYQA